MNSSHIRTGESNATFLESHIERLSDSLNRVENDRLIPLHREVLILRQLVDFQNTKLDKLTSLLTDLVIQLMVKRGKLPGEDVVEMSLRAHPDSPEEDDEAESMLRSIRAFQESVNVNDLQRHNIQQQLNQHRSNLQTHQQQQQQQQQQQTHHPMIDQSRVSMQRMQNQLNHHQNQDPTSGHLSRSLGNTMDPEFHHHAASGLIPNSISSRQVSQDHQTHLPNETNDEASKQKSKTKKRKRSERNEKDIPSLVEKPVSSKKSRSKDDKAQEKVHIEFIHNPTTVREIYDEFYKGYKGQGPLCEMDEKYGKLNWRGDSRTKESKRYQRRKRLCDAIKRGSYKYNKSDDEMIEYLESFRKEKSLTWVMNGNIPDDLKE
ncbi:hypothetical protein I9W82_000741 [Candida metapsilosis]|uniref:Transcription activator GCR1-like domain-containing protein n=1 Tax=Candida metapsilosis TaxID=273372 RepID=A0A8H7ZJV9_9ASCO|nr:hypothetical protein I9W82_000741 [Candida metapsilosis]